jgi:AraC-like DNA-binding protein
MRFVTCPAAPAIADHVLELWLFEDDGRYHAGLPKPYVELVVSLVGEHWWRADGDAPEHRYIDAWVTPLQRAARQARAVGRRCLIGARLQPWSATALFGALPVGNGAPPPTLESLIGRDAIQLRDRLLEASDDDARFARLSDWLSDRLLPVTARSTFPPLGRTVASVRDLADAFDATPRSLRRRFAAEIGLSPKQWLKLRRLDGVLRDAALGDRNAPLVEVALEHGFADQAHLTRDMAHLAGTTPAVLRKRPSGAPPHLLPDV